MFQILSQRNIKYFLYVPNLHHLIFIQITNSFRPTYVCNSGYHIFIKMLLSCNIFTALMPLKLPCLLRINSNDKKNFLLLPFHVFCFIQNHPSTTIYTNNNIVKRKVFFVKILALLLSILCRSTESTANLST